MLFIVISSEIFNLEPTNNNKNDVDRTYTMYVIKKSVPGWWLITN